MIKNLFSSLLLGASALAFSFSTLAESPPTAPAWELKTQANHPISLAQFQGKPVVLHFWATWCPFCKKLQPKLSELQQKYADEGVTIVGISFNEDEGVLPQDELTQRGHQFITAVNGEAVAELYGVRGTPTTFYINKNGGVVFMSTSSDVDDPRIELAIQEIIK